MVRVGAAGPRSLRALRGVALVNYRLLSGPYTYGPASGLSVIIIERIHALLWVAAFQMSRKQTLVCLEVGGFLAKSCANLLHFYHVLL